MAKIYISGQITGLEYNDPQKVANQVVAER